MAFNLHHGDQHNELVQRIAGDAIVSVDLSRGAAHPITLISDDSLRAEFDKTGLTGGRGMAIVGADALPFEPTEPVLTFRFPSVEYAAAFKSWMCDGGGEQDFWVVCDNDGVPPVEFNYHDPGGSIIVGTVSE